MTKTSGFFAAANSDFFQDGVTIRAGISAQILASLVNDQQLHKIEGNPGVAEIYATFAKTAIGLTDALLRELDKA